MNEINNFYLIEHKPSKSKTEISFNYDNGKIEIFSIKMLSGKVVGLNNFKNALNHFKEFIQINEPNNDSA